MRLKEIREVSSVTQFTVSNYLKVSRGTYGMWENEKDIIPIKRLVNFCNLFNVSVDYVLGFTNTKNYKNHKNTNKHRKYIFSFSMTKIMIFVTWSVSNFSSNICH